MMKLREKAIVGASVILGGVWLSSETPHHAVGFAAVAIATIWIVVESIVEADSQ
jgi:hypothetical protein